MIKSNEIMMLIDTSKCIACRACQVACKQWHRLKDEKTTFEGTYQNPPDLSGKTLTLVRFNELEESGKLKWLFFKDQCRHCVRPRCKDACPEGVEIDSDTGAVIFNEKATKENSRIPLEEACPYNVPRYSEDLGRYVKCDLCYDRFKHAQLGTGKFKGQFGNSQKPACELTCPSGAISTGTAKKILEEARKRLGVVKSNGHPNAFIYTGGYGSETHVIWLLTDEPSKYGLPK